MLKNSEFQNIFSKFTNLTPEEQVNWASKFSMLSSQYRLLIRPLRNAPIGAITNRNLEAIYNFLDIKKNAPQSPAHSELATIFQEQALALFASEARATLYKDNAETFSSVYTAIIMGANRDVILYILSQQIPLEPTYLESKEAILLLNKIIIINSNNTEEVVKFLNNLDGQFHTPEGLRFLNCFGAKDLVGQDVAKFKRLFESPISFEGEPTRKIAPLLLKLDQKYYTTKMASLIIAINETYPITPVYIKALNTLSPHIDYVDLTLVPFLRQIPFNEKSAPQSFSWLSEEGVTILSTLSSRIFSTAEGFKFLSRLKCAMSAEQVVVFNDFAKTAAGVNYLVKQKDNLAPIMSLEPFISEIEALLKLRKIIERNKPSEKKERHPDSEKWIEKLAKELVTKYSKQLLELTEKPQKDDKNKAKLSPKEEAKQKEETARQEAESIQKKSKVFAETLVNMRTKIAGKLYKKMEDAYKFEVIMSQDSEDEASILVENRMTLTDLNKVLCFVIDGAGINIVTLESARLGYSKAIQLPLSEENFDIQALNNLFFPQLGSADRLVILEQMLDSHTIIPEFLLGDDELVLQIDPRYLSTPSMLAYLRRYAACNPVDAIEVEALNAVADSLFEKFKQHESILDFINKSPDRFFNKKVFTPLDFSKMPSALLEKPDASSVMTEIFAEDHTLIFKIDPRYLSASSMLAYLLRYAACNPVDATEVEALNAVADSLFEKFKQHESILDFIDKSPDRFFNKKVFTPLDFSQMPSVLVENPDASSEVSEIFAGDAALIFEIDPRYLSTPSMLAYLRRYAACNSVAATDVEALNAAAGSLFEKFNQHENILDFINKSPDRFFNKEVVTPLNFSQMPSVLVENPDASSEVSEIFAGDAALIFKIDPRYLSTSSMLAYLRRYATCNPVAATDVEAFNAAAGSLFEKFNQHENILDFIDKSPDRFFNKEVFTPLDFSQMPSVLVENPDASSEVSEIFAGDAALIFKIDPRYLSTPSMLAYLRRYAACNSVAATDVEALNEAADNLFNNLGQHANIIRFIQKLPDRYFNKEAFKPLEFATMPPALLENPEASLKFFENFLIEPIHFTKGLTSMVDKEDIDRTIDYIKTNVQKSRSPLITGSTILFNLEKFNALGSAGRAQYENLKKLSHTFIWSSADLKNLSEQERSDYTAQLLALYKSMCLDETQEYNSESFTSLRSHVKNILMVEKELSESFVTLKKRVSDNVTEFLGNLDGFETKWFKSDNSKLALPELKAVSKEVVDLTSFKLLKVCGEQTKNIESDSNLSNRVAMFRKAATAIVEDFIKQVNKLDDGKFVDEGQFKNILLDDQLHSILFYPTNNPAPYSSILKHKRLAPLFFEILIKYRPNEFENHQDIQAAHKSHLNSLKTNPPQRGFRGRILAYNPKSGTSTISAQLNATTNNNPHPLTSTPEGLKEESIPSKSQNSNGNSNGSHYGGNHPFNTKGPVLKRIQSKKTRYQLQNVDLIAGLKWIENYKPVEISKYRILPVGTLDQEMLAMSKETSKEQVGKICCGIMNLHNHWLTIFLFTPAQKGAKTQLLIIDPQYYGEGEEGTKEPEIRGLEERLAKSNADLEILPSPIEITQQFNGSDCGFDGLQMILDLVIKELVTIKEETTQDNQITEKIDFHSERLTLNGEGGNNGAGYFNHEMEFVELMDKTRNKWEKRLSKIKQIDEPIFGGSVLTDYDFNTNQQVQKLKESLIAQKSIIQIRFEEKSLKSHVSTCISNETQENKGHEIFRTVIELFIERDIECQNFKKDFTELTILSSKYPSEAIQGCSLDALREQLYKSISKRDLIEEYSYQRCAIFIEGFKEFVKERADPNNQNGNTEAEIDHYYTEYCDLNGDNNWIHFVDKQLNKNHYLEVIAPHFYTSQVMEWKRDPEKENNENKEASGILLIPSNKTSSTTRRVSMTPADGALPKLIPPTSSGEQSRPPLLINTGSPIFSQKPYPRPSLKASKKLITNLESLIVTLRKETTMNNNKVGLFWSLGLESDTKKLLNRCEKWLLWCKSNPEKELLLRQQWYIFHSLYGEVCKDFQKNASSFKKNPGSYKGCYGSTLAIQLATLIGMNDEKQKEYNTATLIEKSVIPRDKPKCREMKTKPGYEFLLNEVNTWLVREKSALNIIKIVDLSTIRATIPIGHPSFF
ncbi:MAG: hypothetical protein H0U71_06660 [Gammaproteobacteria bacterium]|nr:hypothetical protein [Gammaproteobacteria bacterium]